MKRRHHYAPQMYLEAFVDPTDAKGRLYIYDKKLGVNPRAPRTPASKSTTTPFTQRPEKGTPTQSRTPSNEWKTLPLLQ